MRFSALASRVIVAVVGALATTFVVASAQDVTSTSLTPSQAHTIALSRCGTNRLSTQDADCRGFDAREIRESTDTFVLGFENNKELGEKHVMQLVVVFDLSQIAVDPNSEISHAALGYTEASTTRRSPSGDSEYGILTSCDTQLGVPTTEWNGRTDAILPTRPALTAGVTPATTGESGSWDVTPQVREWLAAGQQKGTLVMGGDDQSPDIHEQSMCLSYVFDMGLNVEVSPKP